MDDFNPLASQVESHAERIAELRAAESELAQQLAWYEDFDPGATVAKVAAEKATLADHTTQIAEVDRSIADARAHAERVRPATFRGWNPSYWFSDARTAAKTALARYVSEITKFEASKREHADAREATRQRLANGQALLDRYAKFDGAETEGTLTALQAEIGHLSAEVDALTPRAAALEKDLKAPRHEFVSVRSRISSLKSDLGHAERYGRDLDRASNSYERAMVHEESKRRFGDGSPSKVISKLNRDLAIKERDSEKLERRLLDIGRRGSLNVQSLVIDGSNLCYEGDKLIGLWAVRALCAQLADRFEVTVVFDASIKAKLGLPTDQRLRLQLPGIKVHVAVSRTGADETILDVAQDPRAYVVSNDRFGDYPDKSAVYGDRIIRHEIVNGRILVRDLRVDVEYGNRSQERNSIQA